MVKKIKTKIKSRTWAILHNILASKRITVPTSALISQKTSGGFSNPYINNWQKNGKIIENLYKINLGCRLMVYLIYIDPFPSAFNLLSRL